MPTRHRRYRSLLLPRNDDGMGIAEMVVAMSVIMVVLISAGAAFTRMGEAQRSAEAADRGTQMIQDRLETIRKLPYSLVGCYGDDKHPVTLEHPDPNDLTCPPNAKVTSPPNVSNGELVVSLGPVRPTAAARTAAYDAPMDPLDPISSSVKTVGDQTSGNKYDVTTVVTWAGVSAAPLGYPGDLTKAPYGAKRVTVIASWRLGAKTRSVTRSWLRSPTSAEFVPPKAGTETGFRCPEPDHI